MEFSKGGLCVLLSRITLVGLAAIVRMMESAWEELREKKSEADNVV